jgi:hypothetical protein
VLVALGFLKTKPRPMTSSLKSISTSVEIEIALHVTEDLDAVASISSSHLTLGLFGEIEHVAEPEQPPPLTPTRRQTLLISRAAVSDNVIGIMLLSIFQNAP